MSSEHHLSHRGISLLRTFRAAFEAAIEHQKTAPHEVQLIAEACASHLRSWQPLALLGVSDVLEPTNEVAQPLGDGARYELRMLDGMLNLYIHDALNHDADIGLTASQAEKLVADVRRVLAAGRSAP